MALFGLLPDAPKAPDPAKTAAAQQQYNQQAFNASALNRSGPGGSSTFQKDPSGNVTGLSTSLSPQLQPGWDAGAGAVGSQMGLLPTTGINWDSTTAPAIAQGNMDAYRAMTLPMREQQQSELNVRMGERGLPIGSEISDNQWGNLNRDFANADVNAAAQAWNAVPGMQGQLIQNATNQYNQPINSAAGSLGLLQEFGGLAPEAQQPGQMGGVDYSGLTQQNYENQLNAYNNMWNGVGAVANKGLGLFGGAMGWA